MLIPDEHIDRVKGTVDCRDLADHLGIGPSGSAPNRRRWCPACQGDGTGHSTPDLAIRPERWRCYKCSAGGDCFQLVRLARPGTSFVDAVSVVENVTGVQRPGVPSRRDQNCSRPASPPPRPHPMLRLVDGGNSFVVSALLGRFLAIAAEPDYGPTRQWLATRRIDEAVVSGFGVRSCTPSSLSHALDETGREHPQEVVRASGVKRLWAYGKAGLPFLMIPYYEHGRLVGIKARLLLRKDECAAKKVPRFLAVGRCDLYLGGEALSRPGPILLCEGESDCWAAWSHGFTAAGVPGAKAFRRALAARFAGRDVLLAFDGDTAGRAGAEAVQAAFMDAGLPAPRRLNMPDGTDLADWLRSRSGFRRNDNAQPRHDGERHSMNRHSHDAAGA